ncbi:MAG: exodeoxyribonuclease V subunit gamma [Methylococcales bacterium]
MYLFAFSYRDTADNRPLCHSAILPHWKNSEHGFYSQLSLTENEALSTEAEIRQLDDTKEMQNQLQFFQQSLLGSNAEKFSPLANNLNADKSIINVSCYTAMREVEALYEYVLTLFDKNKKLEPADILIALPDLDTYTPYIRAVFDGSSLNKIPYNISDSLAATESILLNGLTELLNLPNWRFTLEQVMTLLRNHLIQKQFQIDDADIELIESWLEDAGVRWAIDSEHWHELDLPYNDKINSANTWRTGLDRLLLGFSLPKDLSNCVADNIPLYHDVLPVDDIEGSGRELLSRFCNYCEKLFHWKGILNEIYTLPEWQLKLQNLVSDFFLIDKSEEKMHEKLLKAFNQLADDATQVNYDKKLDVKAIRILIGDAGTTSGGNVRLSGSVNIASMNSLAGLPFKHICIIGMNYDAWPNQQREPGFDLMQKQWRVGDRNQSDNDRYTTLQLILSAKESLYLSYTGHNIHNGEEIPPSVLLSEILDVNKKLGCKISTIKHPMHVYSPNNFSKKNPLQSSHSQWLETAKKVGFGRKEFPTLCDKAILSEASNKQDKQNLKIDFEDLCRFFQNPQSYFLHNSLGIFLRDDSKEWHNTEPFNLDGFVDSKVRQIAFAYSNNSSISRTMARASGILPHGEFGEILQQIEQEKVDDFYNTLEAEFLSPVIPPYTFNLKLQSTSGEISIIGTLRNLRPDGLLISQVDDLYHYQKIQLWLQHLILCCVQPKGVSCETQIHYLNDGYLKFTTPNKPQELLSYWLSAYLDGQKQPLSFFDKTSWAYATPFYKKGIAYKDCNREDKAVDKVFTAALKAARAKWHDNYQYAGQHAKSANQYIYRGYEPLGEDFQQLAVTLLKPLMEHEFEHEVNR